MGLLDGKVALITGAGGGLGEAYAKLFAREGAAVVVNDLGGPRDGSGSDKSMADKVVDAIKAEGGRAVANGADISTLAGGQSVFDDAIKHFGRADIWTLAPGALTRMTADLPRYKENPGAALGPDGIAPAVLYMVSDLSGDQTGKVLGVSGPRGVREMRMMEMEGWKPPFTGWKAEDIVTHAKEIFFSEEQIKMGARRF